MKKFTSLFLVISMIVCNLNTEVVEALSSCGKEVKSLVNTLTNTEIDKTVDVKCDKGLAKETTQANKNNDGDNTRVIDSKTKDKQVEKYSDNKSHAYNYKAISKDNELLVYYITTGKFYYIDQDGKEHELPWTNGNSIRNKINFNNLIKKYNLAKSDDLEQEVNFVITGTGEDVSFEFDNLDCSSIPFNIIFYKLNGTNCHFTFKNVRSIYVKGENTITNSTSYDTGLTYSFDGIDSKSLNIANDGSFIVYNKDEDTIDNNIEYSGDIEYTSDNLGGSSILNICFQDNESQGKKFILDSNNGVASTQKKFSTKEGFNALSILLESDNNNYILREENSSNAPYYYTNVNSNNEDSELSSAIKTKFSLKKNISQNYYNVSNKAKVEVIATERGISSYYLVDNLNKAMDICKNSKGIDYDIIFVGNYNISPNDTITIKDYCENINAITFKTKIDDYIYLLNIDYNLQLMTNNTNTFPITFNDIKFNYMSDNKWIYTNGRQLNFGDNVEMVGKNYPSILLGQTLSENSGKAGDNSLIINSGTYKFVVGNCHGTLQNVNIVINDGIFKNKVIGVGKDCNVNGNVDILINSGWFHDEVIAVNGRVGNKAEITIKSGTFISEVLGAGTGSDISNYLNLLIDGGVFKNKLIGVNGGRVNKPTLIINSGTFNDMVFGVSSDTSTEKFALNSIFNKYLLSNNVSSTLSGNLEIHINGGNFNDLVYGVYSGITRVDITGGNVNLEIQGGTFKKDIIGTNGSDTTLTITLKGGKFNNKNLNLIGNAGLGNGKTIINILANITIPIISDFDKLEVGSKSKRVNLSLLNCLDKVDSIGDLYLNHGSKILFKSLTDTSTLNDIILSGDNNTLVLPPNNRNKDNVLIELSGELKTDGNKLNIDFSKNSNTISEVYLIKFKDEVTANVENKYKPQAGYYVRDNKDSGYVILYPQFNSDLEYNFDNNTLYMKNNAEKEKAWWYTKDNTATDVTLNTSELYKYKGYDLFKDTSNVDRNLILTGSNSDKNIIVNNDSLINLNVKLNGINLTNSKITLTNLKSLGIDGVNTIDNSNNSNINDVFTYSFKNDNKISEKISFGNGASYLKILAKEDINLFNGSKENCIDFKFFEAFEKEHTVRLKNNSMVYQFEIPKGTQRLGLLVNSSTYNLYDGTSEETGSSVYVAGNTQDTFTDEFKTSKQYEDVRRANPVNQIKVSMPSEVYFGVNVEANKLNSINKNNWQQHFSVTEIKVKNNSIVVQDEFKDKDGKVHHFVGKGNTDTNSNLKIGYMGVSSSGNMRNYIKLISKNQLNPNVEVDDIVGVNLALKLGDTSIDESKGISQNPLQTWDIPYNKEATIDIQPDFGNNGNFFNVDKNTIDVFTLKSSHTLTFKYGLK